MKMVMSARFKLLRFNEKDKCYREIHQNQLDGMVSPGGFTFIVNQKSVPFDFDAFYCAEEYGVFVYESGRGAFFNDFEISDCYDDDLKEIGLTRKDVTAAFLASASEISEFFVYFEEKDKVDDAGGVGDNTVSNALYKIQLLSVSFEEENGNQYNVAQGVLDKFNGDIVDYTSKPYKVCYTLYPNFPEGNLADGVEESFVGFATVQEIKARCTDDINSVIKKHAINDGLVELEMQIMQIIGRDEVYIDCDSAEATIKDGQIVINIENL